MARPLSIEALRARIAALIAERHELRNAPPTASERRANVAAWCRSQAAGVQPGIQYRTASGDMGDLLALRVVAGNRVELGPILAAILGPDALADALCRGMEDTPDAMSTGDREARIVEIGAELDRLEHDEERLIEASEAAGRPIARRGDARPDVVLRMAVQA